MTLTPSYAQIQCGCQTPRCKSACQGTILPGPPPRCIPGICRQGIVAEGDISMQLYNLTPELQRQIQDIVEHK